ncbi:(+)-borneol dehydrogenase 1-like isoform X2 [Primulina eburnea]|uniref:(+)-borneol dehydrogenase 1-like isoform X2 n=1 Tax=Primulina eburnea TaxID=1245227 RepID=UPI003C6C1182
MQGKCRKLLRITYSVSESVCLKDFDRICFCLRRKLTLQGINMKGSSVHGRLEGKVAIVTGGASGIGASTVRLFFENGANVVIADVQDTLGQSLANKLDSSNTHVCYVHCDVSNEDDIINLVDTTVSKFGHLDIMYNNAGIMNGASESILTTKKADLERMLSVNLVGALLGAKHASRVMVPNKKGCILFTASSTTKIAGIATHSYAVSKYGIVGLTNNLAAELGSHGIRVNCISPFGVLTGSDHSEEKVRQFEAFMGAVGNLKGGVLRAEDIAKAALYLASDEASYVSGMNLVVDGGYSVVNPTLMRATSMMR